MKKFLLLASAALLAGTAMAADDTFDYGTVEGVTIQNLWLKAYNYGNYNADTEYPFIVNQDFDRARTCTAYNGKMYVGYSHKIMDGEELNSGSAHIVVIDLLTGKYEKTLQCTLDGKTIDDLLVSNQVGVDDFGHLWFTTYRQNLVMADGRFRPITVYYVDDYETGACKVAFTLTLPEDEAEAGVMRIDFFDLVGDVTGEKAGTVFMCASAEGGADGASTQPYVYGWEREMGSDEFGPHLSGYTSAPVETYPADQTAFSYGSSLHIVRDEDHSGELFYVDGFTTFPALYNSEGELIDHIGNAVEKDEVMPDDAGCTGICEFNIGGSTFIAYPKNQYSKGLGAEFIVAKMGPDGDFEGIKKLWTVPEKGQCTVTNGGIRLQSFATVPVKDDAGKEGVLLAQFNCKAGLGVYRIAQEGFDAGVQDVIANDANNNAPVEYFNLQGARVSNPAAGQMVIKRQGSDVQKLVIR